MSKFYSQAGQDEWVVNFFESKRNGFFLDIGAFDGIELSNTYYLEQNLNWGGICVEANPSIFKLLVKNRNCSCINAAVSDYSGRINFLPDGLTGKATENKNNSIEVDCTTLEDLLISNSCPSIIDYLSLDIEGFEVKALSKFPFNKIEVILLTVEHNLYNSGNSNKNNIKNILMNNGYEISVENVQHQNLQFEDWYINKKYI